MSFNARERARLIDARDRLFRDPGGGEFAGSSRDFVLRDASRNLFPEARDDVLAYFKRHCIGWWGGTTDMPTGHLLSSQIACVNHLGPIRQRCDLATAILQGLDPDIVMAEPVPEWGKAPADNGFVAFEFIGTQPRLGEKSFTRGANCTSLDAFMLGRTASGARRAFLIEWKYVEAYSRNDKYIPARARVYDHHISDCSSPFKQTSPRDFYYEPFYQLMRQTLLGWLMTQHRDAECESFRHIHVVPAANREFHQGLTAPNLPGDSVGQAWRAALKRPDHYLGLDPAAFMEPIRGHPGTESLFAYLRERYWADA